MTIDRKILRSTALSLLELLVVLTILGIVMAFALPSLPKADPQGPKSPLLFHFFQEARLQALQRRGPLRLTFESVGDGRQTQVRFQPVNEQTGAAPQESWLELLWDPFTLQIPSGELLYSPKALPRGYLLEFDAQGRPDRALLITQPPNPAFLLLPSGALRILPFPKKDP